MGPKYFLFQFFMLKSDRAKSDSVYVKSNGRFCHDI